MQNMEYGSENATASNFEATHSLNVRNSDIFRKSKGAILGGFAVGITVGLLTTFLYITSTIPILGVLAGIACFGLCLVFPFFGFFAGVLGVHLAKDELETLVEAALAGLLAGIVESVVSWIFFTIGQIIGFFNLNAFNIAGLFFGSSSNLAALFTILFLLIISAITSVFYSFIYIMFSLSFGLVFGLVGGVIYAIFAIPGIKEA